MEFRAVWWRRLDEFGLTFLFLSLLVGSIIETIITHRPILAAMGLLWLVMSTLGLGVILTSVYEARLDGDELFLRSFIRNKTLKRNEIMSVGTSIAGKSSSICIKTKKGQEWNLLLKSFSNPDVVTNSIETWWHSQPTESANFVPGQDLVVRAKNFSMMFIGLDILLTIMLVGVPIFQPESLPMLYVSIPLMALLWWFGLAPRSWSVTLSEDGISVKRFGAPKCLPWSKVTSIKLTTISSKGSTNESVWINGLEKPMVVNQVFDDVPRIRDYILAHVDPSKVTDNRQHIS